MWNEICGKIFLECVEQFKLNNIRYFVLRNYQKLPEQNIGKDVDIVVEPKKLKQAKNILKNIYQCNGAVFYDEAVFDRLHCMHGMGTSSHVGIHIDLIGGYLVRGYEIYNFEELYVHTKWYRGFCVLDEFFEGIMLLIYKQFGYQKPKLKQTYRKCIYNTFQNQPIEFEKELAKITSEQFAKELIENIKQNDFDSLICKAEVLTKYLKRYVNKKRFWRTRVRKIRFIWQKLDRIIFRYKKHVRAFAVLAPDGTGKTTFLDALIKELNYYYVNDEADGRCHVYHFRPTILPNLGAVGEKAGIMEQDTNWTDPHRNKPANPISSLIRIAYYTLDYIIGWQKCVRNDVHYDRFSVFDRYSYDFIVDPLRTKLGLPTWVRKFFVRLTPQPKIVFVLDADPEIIYSRKQELTQEEIARQLEVYRKLAHSSKRFRVISAEQTPEEMAREAIKILLEQYSENLEK